MPGYYADGWGLCLPTLERISDILQGGGVRAILEFGSGSSTRFFIDYANAAGMDYTIDSYDHDPAFAYRGPAWPGLKLRITPLLTCSDDMYDRMFAEKTFHRQSFEAVTGPISPNIRNATYDVDLNDLKDNYDLVLLDGPHGNGRNFANFYMKGRLRPGAHIVVDDYFHYDFVDRIRDFFPVEVIEEAIFPEHGGKGHAILKVI